MREDTNEVSANEMLLIFESNPVNEGLARVTAASFCTQLNPTLEEIADLKTAVSEAEEEGLRCTCLTGNGSFM